VFLWQKDQVASAEHRAIAGRREEGACAQAIAHVAAIAETGSNMQLGQYG